MYYSLKSGNMRPPALLFFILKTAFGYLGSFCGSIQIFGFHSLHVENAMKLLIEIALNL